MRFEQAYQGLTPRLKEVLELFLARNSDRSIAEKLFVTEVTVRQHISKISSAFGLKSPFPDNRTSQRHNLVALFAKYKPELIRQEMVVEEQSITEPNFVGREKAISDLNTLVKQGAKCILILGSEGTGKTVLAEQYFRQQFPTVVRLDITKEFCFDIDVTKKKKIDKLLCCLGVQPGQELGISLDRLRTQLELKRIGVLVNNLESILDEEGKLTQSHHNYVELLSVLSGSSVRSLTLITSREKVQENLDVEVYALEHLSLQAWQEYFQQKDIDTNTPLLGKIHQVYQGNALAMKFLRSHIAADYRSSISDYWKFNRTQESRAIKQQVEKKIITNFNLLQPLCPTC